MFWRALVMCIVTQVWVCAQSTQGLIDGRIVDYLTGNGIPGGRIEASSVETNLRHAADADPSGFFTLPLLSPGTYRLRITATDYQAQQVDELPLRVASTLRITFRLRPLRDVWEQQEDRSVFLPFNAVLPFYGPDVDTSRTVRVPVEWGRAGVLESSVSYAIDPAQLRELPLAGRDVYALLVTLPGVTTDTSTGRGLGLSAGGTRPSSSSFLLDGLENNNHLITGPLLTMAPEAVQEYRISTAGFGPEYGRTAGLLANTVTRPGGNDWHGLAHFYWKNEFLNANEFQRNRRGFARRPWKEAEPGFWTAGPIRRDRAFSSLAFEHLRFRSTGDSEEIAVPTAGWAPRPGTFAARLWEQFPNRPTAGGTGKFAIVQFDPPSALNRTLLLPRFDWLHGAAAHRLFVRAAIARLTRPEFIWTPYRDFSSPLTHHSAAPALGYSGTLRPGLAIEARAGWSSSDVRFDRAHSEIPTMFSDDRVLLPGSPAAYSFRNRSRTAEALASVVWVQRWRVFKAGVGLLRRRMDGYLSMGGDGSYTFSSLDDYGIDRPDRVEVSLDRLALDSGHNQLPDFTREYGNTGFHFFAQDSMRASDRLTFHFGLRYESLGAPRVMGSSRDVLVSSRAGVDWASRLSGAQLVAAPTGHLLYRPDQGNWAPRAGFAYDLGGSGRTMIRGAYGVYFDRPFDNLWQNLRNNGFVLSSKFFSLTPIIPVRNILPLFTDFRPDLTFSRLTLFDDDLRTPSVHSVFGGVARQIGPSVWLEVDAIGSAGRNLIATDILNRPRSIETSPGVWEKFRPDWPRIWYRCNLGQSDYSALTASMRYRGYRLQAHAAYTWSHSIDNQSEPLAGDFFDFLPTRPGAARGSSLTAAFSEQSRPAMDRGNSDFDQRHNLVFFSIWDVPPQAGGTRIAPLLRGWKLAELFAIRSGFPFTVLSLATGPARDGPTIENRRPDLVDRARVDAGRVAVAGGRRLLRSEAFAPSPASRQGTLARNALASPGYYNLDVSISRRFNLRETLRLVLRADAFNVLNHANLGTPSTSLGFEGFGEAQFGRSGTPSVFPALTPFSETARQLQLMFRLEF